MSEPKLENEVCEMMEISNEMLRHTMEILQLSSKQLTLTRRLLIGASSARNLRPARLHSLMANRYPTRPTEAIVRDRVRRYLKAG